MPSASLALPHSLPARGEEGAEGASPRNSQPGKGLRLLQSLLLTTLLLLTACPPPQQAWGKRPLTLQPTAPESPHLWCAVMLRGHRTVNSKLSRLCHLLAGLYGSGKQPSGTNRPGVVKPPLTPDGLPDSYPFPWQKISFCYCWLGRSTEECARIYCPMHHWPNCLRNPSSRTFHRWL